MTSHTTLHQQQQAAKIRRILANVFAEACKYLADAYFNNCSFSSHTFHVNCWFHQNNYLNKSTFIRKLPFAQFAYEYAMLAKFFDSFCLKTLQRCSHSLRTRRFVTVCYQNNMNMSSWPCQTTYHNDFLTCLTLTYV